MEQFNIGSIEKGEWVGGVKFGTKIGDNQLYN